MKNTVIKILSLVIIAGVIVSLCSCKLNKKGTPGIMTTNREFTMSTQSAAVKATDLSVKAVAPKGSNETIDFFNKSLENFNGRAFEFTRSKKTTLEAFSAGSLWTTEGATEGYRNTLKAACGDMMGVGSLDTSYYVGDDISQAFAIKKIEAENISSCSASAQGSKVTVSFKYKNANAEGETNVGLLTGDYVNSAAYSSKISSYGATASGSSSTVKDVKLTAVIDYSTKNFTSVTIEYTTDFVSQELSFDYISGGPVKGTTKTVISYGNFKEK